MRGARVTPVENCRAAVADEDVPIVEVVMLDGIRQPERVELTTQLAVASRERTQLRELCGLQTVAALA